MTDLDSRGLEAAAKAIDVRLIPNETRLHDMPRVAAEACVRAYLAASLPPDGENPYPLEWPKEQCDHAHIAWRDGFAAGRAAASPDRWTLTSDNPAAPQWECELCGGKLAGPGEKCGSAQHGPAGTVIYGRAVPSGGPIPDSEFGVTSTVLDPETGIEEPVTTGRIPDAEFVEPPLMPPAASPDERLREALELIRAHARLDLTERGIAEAERYAVIADDALTGSDLLASSTAEKLASPRKHSASASDPMPLCDCEFCARPLRDHEEETR